MSKAALVGVVAFVAGGLCTLCSFTVGYADYTNDPAQHSAILTGVAMGAAAFLFLGCAWRFLGREGKVYTVVVGVLNLLQLVPTVQNLISLWDRIFSSGPK
jgi:hypothetical protein